MAEHTKHPRGARMITAGSLAWIAAFLVFFTIHLIVQAAWTHPPYSWAANNVSDLGNVHCGQWGDNHRYVCSPRHLLMNVGFVLTGLLVVLGAALLPGLWRRSRLSRLGRGLVMLYGLGIMLAGLAPADVNLGIHLLAAACIVLGGSIGLLLTGLVPGPLNTGPVRVLAMTAGGIGVVATYLYFSGNDLMLGMGGMERLWGLNTLVWSAASGMYLLRTPYRRGAGPSRSSAK